MGRRKRNKERGKVNIAKKILSFVPRLLYNILVIMCVLLIAIIVMQKLTDSNRSVGGYKIFKVVSGSMVPQYDIGEVVISKEVPVEEIKIGDDIVYRGKIGDLKDRIVMHEVIEINRDENNELKFNAKGLQNSKGDPEIDKSQILGVVKVKSFILSLLYKLATSIYSSFVIITILVINVFVSFKSGKVEESDEDIDEEAEEIKEEVKEIENTTNTPKTKEDLQNQIQDLRNQINELKKQENNQNKEQEITKKENDVEEEEKTVIDSKEESDKIKNEEGKKTRKQTVKKSETSEEKKASTKKVATKKEEDKSTIKKSTNKKSTVEKVETKKENVKKVATKKSVKSSGNKEE